MRKVHVMKWIMLVFLTVATASRAQEKAPPSTPIDPETYNAAVERLKAKAASQPTEVERLQRENAELRQLVSQLRADIVSLNKQLPAQPKPPKGDEKLKIGMTIAQAREAMGAPGGVDSETATEKTIRFSEFVETDLSSGFRVVFATFEDGKLTRINYSPANMTTKTVPGVTGITPNPPKKKSGGY